MTLLTIREASQLIGRTTATLRRYIRSGRLKAIKEMGKFGEEYKIARDDLLALGFTPASRDLPVKAKPAPIAGTPSTSSEDRVPASVFNELLMKHEQILVQYGMIRAGGQKLLEYKVEAETGAQDLQCAQERYQALRARAAREIKMLRQQVRQSAIQVEDRNIEITLMQERIKRLEMAAAGVGVRESFDTKVVNIRQKEQSIAELETPAPRPAAALDQQGAWFEVFPPGERSEDH